MTAGMAYSRSVSASVSVMTAVLAAGKGDMRDVSGVPLVDFR